MMISQNKMAMEKMKMMMSLQSNRYLRARMTET